MQFDTQTYTISDLYKWYKNGELVLTPKFQRRLTWSRSAKSYLIDTVARGLPIPKIFFRMTIDTDKIQAIREVVDGQQRLHSMFGFIDEEFTVLRSHNPDIGGRLFSKLPTDAKSNILSYSVTADLLYAADDGLVVDVFTRINSYGLTLNEQELRNAKFYGPFKTTVYRLAAVHLEFWRRHRIFSTLQIARMQEAELASELVVSMLDGLQDKKGRLNSVYEKYEDEFDGVEQVAEQFTQIMTFIDESVGDVLVETAFRRRALFYSLFMAVADAFFGIPKGSGPFLSPVKKLTRLQKAHLVEDLRAVTDALTLEDPPARFRRFQQAAARQTDNVAPRRARHTFLVGVLKKAVE